MIVPKLHVFNFTLNDSHVGSRELRKTIITIAPNPHSVLEQQKFEVAFQLQRLFEQMKKTPGERLEILAEQKEEMTAKVLRGWIEKEAA